MKKSDENKLSLLREKAYLLSEKTVCFLREKKLSITAAESCTGGMLSSYITSVAGSSECFNGSFVTYSNKIKTKLIGVSENTLDVFGAVSEECAREMALGAMKTLSSDIALSVSGIAGPEGGSADKPVGTVWICAIFKDNVFTKKFSFDGFREEVRLMAVIRAFEIALSLLK